jgi:RHS repeat-associated protein
MKLRKSLFRVPAVISDAVDSLALAKNLPQWVMQPVRGFGVALLLACSSLSAVAQANVNEEKGMKPYDSWHGGDLDSVSMTNDGLALHIPLASFPQRGALDLSFSAYANTKQWKFWVNPLNCGNPNIPDGCTPRWVPTLRGQQPQIGSTVPVEGAYVTSSLDWIPQNNCIAISDFDGHVSYDWSASLTAPDGNSHPLGGGDANPYGCPAPPYRALEASGMLQSDANTIIFPNGTHFNFTNSMTPTAFTDANGNRITLNASTGAYNDTLGRAVTPPSGATATDVSGCPSGTASAKAWTVPGLSAGTRAFKFCYSTVSIFTNFGQGGIEYGPTNNTLLTAIVLPDSTLWTFAYDHYGDITRLGFPTGGSISYTYAIGPVTCGTDTPLSMIVTSRTVDANDGTGGHTWSYTYTAPGTSAGTMVVTSPSPDFNDTVHTIGDPITRTGGCTLYDLQVQNYQGSHSGGAQPLKTATTLYSANSYTLGGGLSTINVVPQQTTVTWADGHSSKVVNTWDSGNSESLYGTTVPVVLGSVTQKDEYDYSNTLVRSTVNHYLWQDSATYKSNNFLGLQTSTTIKDGAGNQVAQTTYGYDQTAVTSSGITTGLAAPPAGGTIRGNQTTVSHWLNTTNSFISSTAVYFDTGMTASSTDPRNNTTTYSYAPDFVGAYMTQTNMPDTLMPDTGAIVVHHVISGWYDFNTGLLTRFTDENSQNFTYQYDSLMLRLTQGNHPDGGQTIFTYPDPNTVERQQLISGSTYDTVFAKFDGLGRPIQSQHLTLSGTILADTIYDTVGRMWKVSNPYYQGSNHSTDPTYGVTETQYDAMSRAIKTIKQDQSFSTVQYNAPAGDGAVSSVVCTTATDEAGKQRQVCADALGRIVKVLEPNPGATGTPSISNNAYVTLYTYDTLGNLLTVNQKGATTDPAQWRARTFTYDSFSRLLTAFNPETGQTSFQYDPNGNMTSKTSPKPNQTGTATVTTYVTYDPLNRPLDKTYSDGATASAGFRYDYSSYGGASIQNPVGRLVMAWAANQANGGYLMSYDPMGRISLTYQMDPGVACCAVATASYDKLGDLITLNYPSGGFSMTYQYDNAARLTGASDSNGVTYANSPTYLASGAMQEFTSPNFSNNKFHADYNSRLQPTEIWVGSSHSTGVLFDKQYSYNAPNTSQMNNGNVYTVTNVKDDSRTQSFTYDPLNRLLSAGDKTHWANSYVYDAWGNLTNKSQGSLPQGENMQKAADTNNRLSGISYDAAGNVVNDGTGGTYVYDAENRIISATNGTVTTTYVYDALGRRIKKSSGSTATNYWFGPSGETAAETDASGNYTNYIFFGGQRLARNVSGDIKYYITDHLHSTAVFADKSGTVLDDNDFYPWGGVVPGVGTTTSNNHYKFTGKERDTESGLDYFGARYYANVTGRFMSPDWAARPTSVPYAEFGDPQSLNLYSYVRNSPIVRVDADGHRDQIMHAPENPWHGDPGGGDTKDTNMALVDNSAQAAELSSLISMADDASGVGLNWTPITQSGHSDDKNGTDFRRGFREIAKKGCESDRHREYAQRKRAAEQARDREIMESNLHTMWGITHTELNGLAGGMFIGAAFKITLKAAMHVPEKATGFITLVELEVLMQNNLKIESAFQGQLDGLELWHKSSVDACKLVGPKDPE